MIRARVGIFQRVLPHYRVPFFNALNQSLGERDIQLRVFYGQERPGTVPKTEIGDWPWGAFSPNRYNIIRGRELVWQPCASQFKKCDLAIVEHSSRLLLNYIFHVWRMIFPQIKFAYWGHGKNFQAHDGWSLSESIKRMTMLQCDWWFAYTSLSAELIGKAGYPLSRTTVVQNSIDTHELSESVTSIESGAIKQERARLGLKGTKVGLYCGGMYPDKQLAFLIQACKRMKELVPDFEVIFVGDGPDRTLVEQACAQCSWMHYVGAVFGKARAVYFALSSVLLMPGLVGLAVVDSFAARLPMFTTDIPAHSPEIAYLKHGENGWMTEHVVDDYAEAVARYLGNQALQLKLRDGCERSSKIYTLEGMVSNFVDGIERCLATQTQP